MSPTERREASFLRVSVERPIVTETYNDTDNGPAGICVMNPTGLFFNRSVGYDDAKKPGTWHWPERVE